MVEETMQCPKIQLWSSGFLFTDQGTSAHGQYRKKSPSTPQKRDPLIISSTRLESWDSN